MEEIVLMEAAQSETAQPAVHSFYREAAFAVAATAVIALSAHASVPLFFTPVPITLQTLAVLFFGLLLGPRRAFATLALYLIEGASGLPVFSPHGPGGVAQLLGPTGGYLLSYPFAAAAAGLIGGWLCPRLARRFTGGALAGATVAAFTSSLLILAAGAAWLGAVTHEPARAVLLQAVIPFLPGDLIKVILAASAVTGIRRMRRVPTLDNQAS